MNCIHELLFVHLDIDPVSIIPSQPQVVMLGDKVEWQCKTKASAVHTVQWKKVCAQAFPQSSLAGPFIEYKNLAFPRMENSFVHKQLPECFIVIVVKTSTLAGFVKKNSTLPIHVWITYEYSFLLCGFNSPALLGWTGRNV